MTRSFKSVAEPRPELQGTLGTLENLGEAKDLKRLKKHYEQYEPTLTELRHKYEVAMKAEKPC